MKLLVFTILTFLNVLALASPRAPQEKYLPQASISAKVLQIDLQKLDEANIQSLLSQAKNILRVEFLPHDIKQVHLMVGDGDINESKSIYVKFKTEDSAKIMKDLLESGSSFVFLYDTQTAPTSGTWVDVNASTLYVWDSSSGKILKLGELIGPKRSISEQKIMDRIMIQFFGNQRLNEL